jgi:putative multiple sugar transport system permease protein
VAAALTVQAGLPVWIVIPATLVVGGIIGAAQGYWVAFWRIPSFIVTLAGMLVFRGLTLWLLGGQNIGPFPKTFQAHVERASSPTFSATGIRRLMGLERLNGTPFWSCGGGGGADLAGPARAGAGRRIRHHARADGPVLGAQRDRDARWSVRRLEAGAVPGLPNVLVILVVLTVIYAFFTENTTPGGASMPPAATKRRPSCRASAPTGWCSGASSTWGCWRRWRG